MATDTAALKTRKRSFRNMEDLGQITEPFLNDEFVTIALDGSEERFKVSKALLCQASDYFTKALDGGFREGSERLLRLPGCDVPTFRLFFGFLTCKALPAFHEKYFELFETRQRRVEKNKDIQILLINLWAFGDRHIIPSLCNVAMRSLLKLLDDDLRLASAASPESVRSAFETTGKDSILSDMLICEFTENWKEGKTSEDVLDQIGLIPGFFAVFLAKLEGCRVECCHGPPCRPSLQQEMDDLDPKYMVPK